MAHCELISRSTYPTACTHKSMKCNSNKLFTYLLTNLLVFYSLHVYTRWPKK